TTPTTTKKNIFPIPSSVKLLLVRFLTFQTSETMTLAIEIEKKHIKKSERVKSLEIHPTEPWVLVSLYTGTVQIWNYQSQTVEKNYQVSESPVRSAKFIAREKSIVVGSDDHFIRVYNYTTEEKTKEFKAHDDYIRSLAVHPSLPYVLSCSDDTMIKLWDWEKDWACTQIFKGHNHYVMQVAFNPKDQNQTFTSVSLDCTMKMWNLSSSDPILELEAHSKGINCVDFLTCNDKQYLITGSDDHTAKVWDLQNQTCVQILEGHKNNISALALHPELPAFFTGSEDGTFSVWDATNYSLLNTQISELGRIWAIGFASLEDSHILIIGCDEGMIIGKIV
uniref:Beta'-coat protein n=2 Tax=Solanum lycopersicum TaxID=4081 RepID=A0A3Q7GKB8_SOLLC